MQKRILSSILALCMVMGMAFALPITVGAKSEGDYTYTVENGEACITACDTEISGSVIIPSTLGGYPVTSIGGYAFEDCSQMTSVTIPDSVTNIEHQVFSGCSALYDISIGNNVTKIGSHSFDDTAYYNEASNWTDDVLYIGNYLIAAKLDITGNLEIPGNIKVIADGAFDNCTELWGVTIPDGVIAIGANAFYTCSGLSSVTIPDSVTEIYFRAFYGCTALSDITIGNNVAEIKADVFTDTAYYNNASNWTDNALYIGKYFLKAKNEISGNYAMPETIEIIADEAFYSCSGLTNVTIPDSVTDIGFSAFENCTGLTNVTIPNNVITISDRAFARCNNLESVNIGNSVTTIGVWAFGDCTKLTSVTIPASVTNIGREAFGVCSVNIDIDEDNPSYCVSDGHIFSKDMTAFIRYDVSKTATEFTIPNTVTTIKEDAFSGANLITTVTIPASVQEIGANVFNWCEKLASINVAAENANFSSENGVLFNKNKTEIILYPKEKTDSSYSIPSSVTTIAENCFINSYLHIIALPETLSSVEESAFYDLELDSVLYGGTEQQWQEINIASYNEILTEANIIYEYDEKPAKIKDVSCIYDSNSGKLSANVTFDYLFDAGDLLLAIYDDSGRFVDVKKETLTLSDANGSFEFDADDSCLDYTAKAFYWDGIDTIIPLTDSIEVGIKQAYVIDTVLESEHPYPLDTEVIKTYTYDGDCTRIDVTFSLETETEEDYDYICIYDADGNEIGVYTGTELAGKTVSVPGNTVKICLTSDEIETCYGFKTESIVVYK